MKNKINIRRVIIILMVGFIVGMLVENYLIRKDFDPESLKLLKVLNLTDEYYVDTLKRNQLVKDAIEGMFDKLDPHTSYIPPIDQELLLDDIRGDFEGIGVEFNVVDDTINVVTVLSGGPSETVGIESGDRIVAINDTNCIGYTNADVIKNLRGPKGSEVKLTVFRNREEAKLEFNVVRDYIPSNSVDASFMLNDTDGFVVLSKFSETSTDELVENIDKLRQQGMQRLILDLRNNPGGLLGQARSVSDLFIPGKQLIVFTEGRGGIDREELYSDDEYPYEEIPLVVLVSRGSASASEIVSGAVQDLDRGLIVGETTFGKGLVQRPFTLDDGSAVRITIARYYTPSGRAIQRDYNESKEDYYTDVLTRDEEEGDNYNHEEETDSTRAKFKTKKGRTVLGGGGITPDYIIKSDTLGEVSRKLRRGNIFYKFSRNLRAKYFDQIEKDYSNNIQKFADDFLLSVNDFNDLAKFVKENDIDLAKKDILDEKENLSLILKAYLARTIWREEGWYRVMNTSDRQLDKAVSLLGDAEEMIKN